MLLARLSFDVLPYRAQPQIDAPWQRKCLWHPRNDDDPLWSETHVEELGVLSQQDRARREQSPTKRRVRNASQPERDDVIRFELLGQQPPVERQREVLIEEELHEALATAGGRCAATCAAYCSAVLTCSVVSR